jgi:hypothetical protein
MNGSQGILEGYSHGTSRVTGPRVACWFAFYNFCRIHQSLRTTPYGCGSLRITCGECGNCWRPCGAMAAAARTGPTTTNQDLADEHFRAAVKYW